MSIQPLLPPLVLLAVAAVIVALRLSVLRRLTAAERTPSALWRWCGLTLAALLLLVAAARPVLDTEEGITRIAGAEDPNVFLLVDRSAGMGVEDSPDGRSRMAAARDDIAAVLGRYPDARFAVIAFASSPSLDWPLSADVWSLRPELAALMPYASTPEDVYRANVAAAGNVLRYQLIAAVQQYPKANNLVFYFGAGAGESRSAQRQFNPPEGAVDGGAVLGYGTAAGGPISMLDDVRSAIDERALRTVADEIGVPYVNRGDGAPLVDALPDATLGDGAGTVDVESAPRVELYWLFALTAAAVLLIELYLVLRELRRSRSAAVDVAG